MDNNHVARELLKLAKSLTATNRGLVKKAVIDLINKRPVYPIVKGTLVGTKVGDKVTGYEEFLITGTINAVDAWLEERTKNELLIKWEIVGMTTDRNDARKKADEV